MLAQAGKVGIALPQRYGRGTQAAILDVHAADARAIGSEFIRRAIAQRGAVASIVVDLDQRVIEQVEQLTKRLRRQVGFQVQFNAMALGLRQHLAQISHHLITLAFIANARSVDERQYHAAHAHFRADA